MFSKYKYLNYNCLNFQGNKTNILCKKSTNGDNLEKSMEWGLVSLYCILAFIIFVIIMYSLYCLRKVKKNKIREIMSDNDYEDDDIEDKYYEDSD